MKGLEEHDHLETKVIAKFTYGRGDVLNGRGVIEGSLLCLFDLGLEFPYDRILIILVPLSGFDKSLHLERHL